MLSCSSIMVHEKMWSIIYALAISLFFFQGVSGQLIRSRSDMQTLRYQINLYMYFGCQKAFSLTLCLLCACSSLFAAVSYGVASMAMVFINKAVLMQYAHSMTLLFLQVLVINFLFFQFCLLNFVAQFLLADFAVINFLSFFLAIGNNLAYTLWSSDEVYKSQRSKHGDSKEAIPSVIILQCKCGICFSQLKRCQYSYVYCIEETYTPCCLSSWIFFREGETSNAGMWFGNV